MKIFWLDKDKTLDRQLINEAKEDIKTFENKLKWALGIK